MLQISNPKPAGTKASYYFNYYIRDTNGQAIWFRQGAELFELRGTIEKEKFANFLNGFTPDKKHALVKNAGDPNRQAFWDLTFSVPKAVSVAWVMGSDKVRLKIERAIARALRRTLQHIEKEYGLSRRGAGGKMWVPAALTFALFPHINSRENQPQLHWHCLLFNLGIREDGTVGTLKTNPLFDAKLTLGAYFRHELARELAKDLGFNIEHDKSSFQISGIPKEICDHFSKRRHQIVDYMRSHEMSGGKEAKIAAVATRAPKKHTPRDELLMRWQKESVDLGFTQHHVEVLCREDHLKEVPKLPNVVMLRPTGPLDKGELFQKWCEKTEQREFIDEQDLDELGMVFSSDPKNPLSPPNKNRKPAMQEAWREYKKGSYECFDNWFQSKKEELQSELKSQFRVIKGGADNPNNQEKSNQSHITSPAELTRIRLKTREEEAADFFARYPHLAPGANRTSHQQSRSEQFRPSGEQPKPNEFGAKTDSGKNDEKQPDQEAKSEELLASNEKSKRDEFRARYRNAESDKKQYAKRLDQTKSTELKKFKRELREAFDKIFPENQKPRKVERVAFAIGAKFGISTSDILEAIDELKLPVHRRFYRVEFKPLFPNAPRWNRLAHIRTPRIILQNTARKWGGIHWSKPIPALFGPKIEVRW